MTNENPPPVLQRGVSERSGLFAFARAPNDCVLGEEARVHNLTELEVHRVIVEVEGPERGVACASCKGEPVEVVHINFRGFPTSETDPDKSRTIRGALRGNQVPSTVLHELRLDNSRDPVNRVGRRRRDTGGNQTVLNLERSLGKTKSPLNALRHPTTHHEVEVAGNGDPNAVRISSLSNLADSHPESSGGGGVVNSDRFFGNEVFARLKSGSRSHTVLKGANPNVLVSLATNGEHVVGEAVDKPERIVDGLLKSPADLEPALLDRNARVCLGIPKRVTIGVSLGNLRSNSLAVRVLAVLKSLVVELEVGEYRRTEVRYRLIVGDRVQARLVLFVIREVPKVDDVRKRERSVRGRQRLRKVRTGAIPVVTPALSVVNEAAHLGNGR